MSDKNTFVRSLHDLGLAAWFGGSLMGAIGLNGAAARAKDPSERTRLSADGWALWTPWQIGAVGVHAIGGLGLIAANRNRVKSQGEAAGNTTLKLALTGVAAAVTAYSGVLGAKVKKHQSEGAEGSTEPGAGASEELAASQKQLKVLQWSIPAVTAVLLVLGAQQGEQQRSVHGIVDRITHR